MSDSAPAGIPHSRPSIEAEDLEAVAAVLRGGRVAQGPRVAEFEAELARALGVEGGVAVSSGTAALHLALLALGVGAGDEVLVPSYACAALLQAVRAAGARPRPVDCDPASLNLDPDAAKRASSARTKALVVVHSFGLPAELEALTALGVPVIEDLAHALGATYRARPVGSAGAVAVASFYATKLITTGEGGMLLSSDARVLAAARDLRAYDERLDDRPRFNYKLTDLAAALGLAQLRRLPRLLARRAAIAARYDERLRALPLARPVVSPDRARVYFRYVVQGPRLAAEYLPRLEARGVQARRPVFRPLHRYLGLDGFPGTEEAWAKAVSLPLYPALTDAEAERVAAAATESFP